VKPLTRRRRATSLYILQSTPKDDLIDVLKGKVDLAAAAVPLDAMISGAERDGVKVSREALVTQVIGANRTAVLRGTATSTLTNRTRSSHAVPFPFEE